MEIKFSHSIFSVKAPGTKFQGLEPLLRFSHCKPVRKKEEKRKEVGERKFNFLAVLELELGSLLSIVPFRLGEHYHLESPQSATVKVSPEIQVEIESTV